MGKLVCGVGVNDSETSVATLVTIGKTADGKLLRACVWRCPYYEVWRNMLQRCYNTKLQEKYPTYKGCTVHGDWLLFSKFKAWMETQDWEENYLDKDILFPGNKVYSPETCVFVSRALNNFINERSKVRGQFPLGVHWNKRDKMFVASISDGKGKSKHLGYFTTPEEAHVCWLEAKTKLAVELGAVQKDTRVAEALVKRYENLKEVEDAS